MNLVDLVLIIISLTDLIIIGGFSIIRTYYQRKSVQLQETILKESREYWNSWQKRSQNIALDVKDEIKKEKKDEDQKSKRTITRNRTNRSKTHRDEKSQSQT